MLHVFQVDYGRMMKLDMSLTVESVASLKSHIEEQYKINPDSQVLLASGGVMLTNKTSVGSHSAGTDSNPIYLYDRHSIGENNPPPADAFNEKKERELDLKVQKCRDLPVRFETMLKRSQMAQEINEQGRQQFSVCEKLVYEQHLQQQGWRAIVANLDDVLVDFRKRARHFQRRLNMYLTQRSQYSSLLTELKTDIETLHRIPVLTSLLESRDGNRSTSIETDEPGRELTLFDWISSRNKDIPLNSLYDLCSRGLAEFDGTVFQRLSRQIDELLKKSHDNKMREVIGMSQRLSGLEDLMRKAREHVQNQNDIAVAFMKQEVNAKNAKDESVLPDLCSSHEKQLQLMADNHKRICDILRRCVNAKTELTKNLHARLKWVVFIQNSICELDQRMVIHEMNLTKLQKYLDILHQVHTAPSTYLSAVTEVTRRRKFSRDLLMCGTELARHLNAIHDEEMNRRQRFRSRYHLGLLAELFRGLDDFPPAFATQAPPEFDGELPPLTEDDIDRLKQRLPDMEESLKLPDMLAITEFTWSETASKQGDVTEAESGEHITKEVDDEGVEGEGEEEKGLEAEGEDDGGEEGAVGGIELDRSERGCDSDTDSGGFENVLNSPVMSPSQYYYLNRRDASTVTESLAVESVSPQSPKDVRAKSLDSPSLLGHQPPSADFVNDEFYIDESLPSSLSIEAGQSQGEFVKQLDTANNVVALLQENLEMIRSENEKLKSLLLKLYQLAKEETSQLKNDMVDLKSTISSNSDVISQQCKSLDDSWVNVIVEREIKDKAAIKKLQKSELILLEFVKRQRDDRISKLEKLESEKEDMQNEIAKSVLELQELRESNLGRAEEIEKLREKMKERELEWEKSVKETVERLHREHKAEIETIKYRLKLMATMERSPSDNSLEKSTDFSSLTLQMRENFEMDKERSVAEAVAAEREKWERLLEERVREIEEGFEKERKALLVTISDDRREFEEELDKREADRSLLMEEIETLRRDNANVMWRLSDREKEKVDVTTSPIRQKDNRAETSSPRTGGKVSIDSCKAGDTVVVVWEPAHESFRILQENKHMFFLHSDYLEGLGLEVVDGKPNKTYVVGEVVDKEYCCARKSENRYKVPKRMKFFRVKVKPCATASAASSSKDVTQSLYEPKISQIDATRMTRSHTLVSTVSEDAFGPPSSPSSPTRTHPIILESDEPDSTVKDGNPEDNAIVACDDQLEIQEEKSVEATFAEDSGIVDNVEQALAAMDDSESADRDLACTLRLEEQRTYISSSWLETMISRVFNKSVSNE